MKHYSKLLSQITSNDSVIFKRSPRSQFHTLSQMQLHCALFITLVLSALVGSFVLNPGLPPRSQKTQTLSFPYASTPIQVRDLDHLQQRTGCGADVCSTSCCNGQCCLFPAGSVCCGDGHCCQSGGTCCDDGSCCTDGGICCGDQGCCPAGGACCGGGACCKEGETCCGNGFCC
jgi:hypothetical protein